MWARISEILLGIWLFIAHFVFKVQGSFDLWWAFFICLIGLLSYIPKLNKLHLLQLIPTGALLYVSYTYPTHILPFFMQNYILVGLSLLMFCIIPSHASDHPRPWQEFLDKHQDKE